MKNLCVVLAVVVGSVLLSSPVHGALFSFSVDQSDYSVLPGHSIQVPVYLQEYVLPPDTSFLAAQEGLWTADVLAQRTTLGLLSPARLTGASANEHDFDDLPATLSVADGQASIYEMATSGVLGDGTFSGGHRIELGTFTLTAGTIVGETTTFQVTPLGGGFDGTVTWLGTVLDGTINSTSFAVEVIPVPAPPGLVLGLTGLSSVWVCTRGRFATAQRHR
jgi:hypothetical protein